MDEDGSNLRQLTDTFTAEVDPRWSPDGRQIVFAGNSSEDFGDWNVYVMNEDGSGRTQLTSSSGYYPTWFWLTDVDSAVHAISWGELKQEKDQR